MNLMQILEASSGEVVVLHGSHLTSFKTSDSAEDLPSPLCRSLSTTSWEGPRLGAGTLERPNVVNGVPAAGTVVKFIFIENFTSS